MISGPTDQPTYEKIFETKHHLTSKATAEEFGFEYGATDNSEDLKILIQTFFDESNGPKLIEYFSDAYTNTEDFKAFKKRFTE